MKTYTAFLIPEYDRADDGRFETIEADTDTLAFLIAEACCRPGEWVEEIREEATRGVASPDRHHRPRLLGSDQVPRRHDMVTKAMKERMEIIAEGIELLRLHVQRSVLLRTTRQQLLDLTEAVETELADLKGQINALPQ